MEAQERRDLIERRILSDGEANFKTLSQEFGVSEMTVRRDLELLEQSGSVRRIMGGAIAVHGTAVEPGFDARALVSAREKVGISIAAVEHLIPGETVVLDSGSTALAV